MSEIYKIVKNLSGKLKENTFYLVPIEEHIFEELNYVKNRVVLYSFDLYFKTKNKTEKIDSLMLIYLEGKFVFSVSLNLNYYRNIKKIQYV